MQLPIPARTVLTCSVWCGRGLSTGAHLRPPGGHGTGQWQRSPLHPSDDGREGGRGSNTLTGSDGKWLPITICLRLVLYARNSVISAVNGGHTHWLLAGGLQDHGGRRRLTVILIVLRIWLGAWLPPEDDCRRFIMRGVLSGGRWRMEWSC